MLQQYHFALAAVFISFLGADKRPVAYIASVTMFCDG